MRLSFIIDLRDSKYDLTSGVQGPLFSKFMPDDNTDNIKIEFENGQISFWFERRGFHEDDGLIRFDFAKKEINEESISRQGIIEGGPLFGEVQIKGDFPADLLAQQSGENEQLVKYVKGIIKIISKETQKILDVIRFNFGQYWIIDNIHWDSRIQSLGYYCKNVVHLKVFNEATNNWLDIEPNPPLVTMTSSLIIGRDYSDYLTKNNWEQLKSLINSGHSPSFAQQQLIKAFISLDSNDLTKAFIDAVTVLDIALEKHYDSILNKSKKVGKILNRIKNIGKSELISIIFGNNPSVKTEDIENAIDAIKIRNNIVHEGHEPQLKDKSKVISLLKLNSLLINEPASFMVSSNPGNTLDSPKKK